MSPESADRRRIRVERNIYRRASGAHEVGIRDASGKQRWRTVQGGITAARAVRDELLARRGRGEQVEAKTLQRFGEAAAEWLDGPVQDLRPRTGECYRNAINTHLLPRFGTHRLDSISPDDLAGLVRQVDRRGERQPTKTDGSVRTVPIPRELALRLSRHKLASRLTQPQNYVFSTRNGGPLRQRNVARALRLAQQRAVDSEGNATFPILHQVDEGGRPATVPRGALPSMHSFRHTVASRALLVGESIDEIAFLLGHRDANVTRAVYVRELTDSRRHSMRRSRMLAEFSELFRP
jgi:Phage integrase family/Phage integrase, N-terminal SAM-like domain